MLIYGDLDWSFVWNKKAMRSLRIALQAEQKCEERAENTKKVEAVAPTMILILEQSFWLDEQVIVSEQGESVLFL